MEETIVKPLDIISSMAGELRDVQEQLTDLNSKLKLLESRRGKLSDAIVSEVEKLGGSTETGGIDLKDVGFIKITSKPNPKIMDIDSFMSWSQETGQAVPSLSINSKTLQSWYDEQMQNGSPVPTDPTIMTVFWKTTARVNRAA